MSLEFEQLNERLKRLERLFELTRLPDDSIVGADYVARLFNCSEASVVRGRFGTNRLKRVRNKPLGFRKGDVDKVLRELTRPVTEKAAEARSKAKVRRIRTKAVV